MFFFLENIKKFTSRNYYYGLMHEYGIETEKDLQQAYNFYLKGATTEYDHMCAAKILLFHLEPSKLNQELPDYDIKRALTTVLDVFLHNGIFEVYTPKIKIMDLLYIFYLQMDLSILLREYVIEV